MNSFRERDQAGCALLAIRDGIVLDRAALLQGVDASLARRPHGYGDRGPLDPGLVIADLVLQELDLVSIPILYSSQPGRWLIVRRPRSSR